MSAGQSSFGFLLAQQKMFGSCKWRGTFRLKQWSILSSNSSCILSGQPPGELPFLSYHQHHLDYHHRPASKTAFDESFSYGGRNLSDSNRICSSPQANGELHRHT